MTKAKLIPPYGGKLVNLVVEGKEREELLARASKLPSIKITMRNLCDLELIASGGFSPLTTFMGKADYERGDKYRGGHFFQRRSLIRL